MFRSSAIPATASAGFDLAPSPWQRRWLLLGHLLVALMATLALPPWPLLLAIFIALPVHGWWQWRRLVNRHGWRLRWDSGGLSLDRGAVECEPVDCRVRYLSRWLLVFELKTASGVDQVALWRDGFEPEPWRQLQIIAREQLRGGTAKPQGEW